MVVAGVVAAAAGAVFVVVVVAVFVVVVVGYGVGDDVDSAVTAVVVEVNTAAVTDGFVVDARICAVVAAVVDSDADYVVGIVVGGVVVVFVVVGSCCCIVVVPQLQRSCRG